MEKTDVVRAADICLRVLQRIAFANHPLGVTQIASDVGIAKGAVFKHLRTLLDHGMIVQDPQTTLYSPGPKLWLMAQNVSSGPALTEVALPLMRGIRDELGCAVVLSVPTPRAAFVLATLPSTQAIEIGVRPGSELSLHSSAQGKIFLAFGPPGMMADLPEKLLQITPRTRTDRGELQEELAIIRKTGFATAPEESLLGVNAIAAPIFGNQGQLLGSIGLIASVQHLGVTPSQAELESLLSLTREIGRRAS